MMKVNRVRAATNLTLTPVIACLFLCIPGNAQSDVFTWTYIHVDIEIQEDGGLLVSEEQQYSYKTGHGATLHKRERLFSMDMIEEIRDVEVYEVARSGGMLPEPLSLTHKRKPFQILWWHELAPPETRTFALRYRVIGAIHSDKPTDVLRWAVAGRDTPAPDAKATVRVHLPPRLRGKTNPSVENGIPADIRTSPDGRTIDFNARLATAARPGFEIRVSFPHGLLRVKEPGLWALSRRVVARFGRLAVLLLFVVVLSYLITRMTGGGQTGGSGCGG